MFYNHNKKLRAAIDKRIPKPVSTIIPAYPKSGQENFGLLKPIPTDDDHTPEMVEEPKIQITQLDYETVKTQLANYDSDKQFENIYDRIDADMEFSQSEALSILQSAESSYYVNRLLKVNL